jgi:hypothetical protein
MDEFFSIVGTENEKPRIWRCMRVDNACESSDGSIELCKLIVTNDAEATGASVLESGCDDCGNHFVNCDCDQGHYLCRYDSKCRHVRDE